MLDKENLVQLMKAVTNANTGAVSTYSYNGKTLNYEDLEGTLRQEFKELAGSHALYRENKNTIFSLIETWLDDVLPKRVTERYMDFAETKVFAQGDKPIFRRRLNANSRAKQFITRVGLAGVYEAFKLSRAEEAFEVRTSAIGGAAQIGFEEWLDGRVDFSELLQVILDGMDELIYREIGESLKASIGQLPQANRVAAAGFDEKAFDKLLTIAAAYGTPVIYCTYEFAVNMIPKEAWRYTEEMKSELWNTGRLAKYKQYQVVILEQGFEDGTNTTKVIDPGYAWIIPSGANNKPVKIAIEGDTLVDEFKGYDRSREIQVYKKVGVATMMTNNICVYGDTSLMGQMETWNLDGISGKVYTYDGRLSGQGA